MGLVGRVHRGEVRVQSEKYRFQLKMGKKPKFWKKKCFFLVRNGVFLWMFWGFFWVKNGARRVGGAGRARAGRGPV